MKQPFADVSRETRERLNQFEALLRRWQPRINLIARGDIDAIWSRHIDDSLQLLPLLPQQREPAIDLGSGAGFPGLILSIAGGFTVHLVEADKRKAAFLREAARITSAEAIVHDTRIEAMTLPPAAVVTARALAPLERLLPLAATFVTPATVLVLPKGRGWQAELTAVEREWQMTVERFPSRFDADGIILRLTGVTRA